MQQKYRSGAHATHVRLRTSLFLKEIINPSVGIRLWIKVIKSIELFLVDIGRGITMTYFFMCPIMCKRTFSVRVVRYFSLF